MKYIYKSLSLYIYKYTYTSNYTFNFNKSAVLIKYLNVSSDCYYVYISDIERKKKIKKNQIRSDVMNKYLRYSLQFIKIMKKDGLFYKYFLYTLSMMRLHHLFYSEVNEDLNKLYNGYYAFHLFAKNNFQFYSLDFLLDFVSSIVDPCIQIKVVMPPKFLRKKQKKRFDFQLVHVDPKVRARFVFKRIILHSSFYDYKYFIKRVYMCLTSIFLKPKVNRVYSEKIFFYKHAMKMYKLGRLKMYDL